MAGLSEEGLLGLRHEWSKKKQLGKMSEEALSPLGTAEVPGDWGGGRGARRREEWVWAQGAASVAVVG